MYKLISNNPYSDNKRYNAEIFEEIKKVLYSGNYILGAQCDKFEKEFARYLNVNHAVGVSSGTDAILVSLLALGIKRGDEIITVANTANGTISPIIQIGAKPVFVDIDPLSYNMNPSLIESAITDRTKAILAVHLYGYPANMNPIVEIAKKYNLYIIEDCAQSTGSKYFGRYTGTIGDVCAFSFYPTKVLGAMGDGGMVVTNNKLISDKLRKIRAYGWKKKFYSEIFGVNSRLDEMQAAILRIKLKYLNECIVKRRNIAKLYTTRLSKLPLQLPYEEPNYQHVYHLFVIQLNRRDELNKFLNNNKIYSQIHYPFSLHMQPAYKGLFKISQNLKETESISKRILSLPIFSEMHNDDIELIINKIERWFS